MPSCNTTLEDSYIDEEPLFMVHDHPVTFHHLGLFVAAIFGLISVVVALLMVMQHARYYSRPYEQRHVIRILIMIPVYSTVSFLSFLYYRKSVYFEVLRDCYEAFAIASFFALLCHYCAPTLHEQKDFFRALTPVNWFWGVFGLQKCTGGENKGPFRKPRSGLTWFNICWIGIFQYCLIRVIFTIVSVITEALNLYCEASLSPAFAHIWTVAFECISVTIAMFLLVQFYIQLKNDLAEHKPFLKVLSIKLVIFFSFWQTIVISLLSSSKGPLKPTAKLSYQSIKVGIPNVLLCIEMAIFAIMHVFAFPYKRYKLKNMYNEMHAAGAPLENEAPKYHGGFLGMSALADAFNPWDFVKALARGFRWLFVGYRHREEDVSYQHANKLNYETTYGGSTLGVNSDQATELRQNNDGFNSGRADGAEDDRAALLRHSALMSVHPAHRGDSASPSRPFDSTSQLDQDARYDLGSQQPDYYHAVSSYDENEYRPPPSFHTDTGYHPAPSSYQSPPIPHHHRETPYSEQQSPPSHGWDSTAGGESQRFTNRPGMGARPPTYRSEDPYPDRF